jgi:hypothetical protein
MKLKKSKLYTHVLMLVVLFVSTTITGCGETKATVDNSSLCVVKVFDTIPQCEEGKPIAFLPASWGNDQLPLYFIALHCDFNHQIVYNDGGVVCIYTAQRNKKLLEAPKK